MMNYRYFTKWLIVPVVLIGFLVTPGISGDDARIGTASGLQLQLPVGARDIAMGGANLALTSGVDAIYWNPAGLPRMESRVGAQFSTMSIFNDIKVHYLGIGAKMGNFGTVAFSIKALDFGDIPLTTNQDMDGASGQTFSPTFVTTGVTYAKELTSAVNVGITAKVILESIPSADASAFAFDIGLQYDDLGGLEGVSFGVAIKNIGTNMRYGGSGLLEEVQDPASGRQDFLKREASSNQLPASFEIGAAYKRSVAENSNILLSSLFQNNNFGNDEFKIGAEYNYSKFVFLRGGYNFVSKTDSDDQLYTFTLGAGLSYKLGTTNLGIDYAYRDSQYFDANNIFSLTVGF
ncbi:MAG: PorV/PorQ family protein [Calditrichaceae bacterium]